MFQTESVVQFPQSERGVLDVIEFTVAVQIDAAKFHMIVDVRLVHMGRDDKLISALRKFHSQFIPQLICVLRRDLSRRNGLDHAVDDDVPVFRLFPPGVLLIEEP